MSKSRAERWAPIAGYEGSYEVSNHGRVRSIDRHDSLGRKRAGKVLKPWLAKRADSSRQTAHQLVDLNRGGKRRAVYVHALVLAAFVGPRPNGMEACHDDGDPTNNDVSNLRWDSHTANMADLRRHGRHNMSNRDQCPRQHELREPNLVPSALSRGRRACHACALARSYARTHASEVSQEVSDRYYSEILAGVR